jgi:alkanesulfonate monooxygenase SsuD/methylene tetrahydromethanopterin reductase-like flavin-dependent oxidoreductase (luciferase family)
MKFGVHLPQTSILGEVTQVWNPSPFNTLADELGYSSLVVLDNIYYPKPWLEALDALSVAASCTKRIQLGTSVVVPVVRHPILLAKALATIDVISQGRLTIGVGAGTSEEDYKLVGIPFSERWVRFGESISCMKSVLRGQPFEGAFYTSHVRLEPLPYQSSILIGSWGLSEKSLQRVALADGWISSALSPRRFEATLDKLNQCLIHAEKDVKSFPNKLSTMFTYITESRSLTEEICLLLARILRRDSSFIRENFLIGGKAECIEKLRKLQAAGVQEVFLFFLKDEMSQLKKIAEELIPFV